MGTAIWTSSRRRWRSGRTLPTEADHPQATAWILYGDGKGGFRRTVLVQGHGWHEGKLADLDGDGDLDVASKPYTWKAPRIDFWLNNGI